MNMPVTPTEHRLPAPLPLLANPLRHPSIEKIWIAAAAAIGWRVERGAAAYASSDGQGQILIGVDDILDVDDAVAQLIFHELCHGFVEGPERWTAPDWGLCNADDRDAVREHACLRVQAHLAEPHGLRELMAPTTDYRQYHDALGGDPLAPAADPAAVLARVAINRVSSLDWMQTLERALAATRAALNEVATRRPEPGPPALHPVGFALADHLQLPDSQASCGTCAWHYVGGRGKGVGRCRQSAGPDGNGRRTEARFRACVRWEPQVDCRTCGACCREAYHSVTVSVRDPVVWKQPDLVMRSGHRFEVCRDGDRCAALVERTEPAPDGFGSTAPVARRLFTCRIYDDRPLACRDFEAGGRHCLVARRRVGLSP
jgi:Fe-S-cluster containining protein